MNIRLLAPLALSLVACATTTTHEASQENLTQLEGDVRFECTTSDAFYGASKHTVSFTVRNVEESLKPASRNLFDDISDDEGNLVSAAPEDSKLSALNENGGAQLKNGKLTIDGDSDGFFLVKLVLYKNSGFTKGYVSLKDMGEGIGNQYSKVTCTQEKVIDGIDENAPVGDLVSDLAGQWDLPDYPAPVHTDFGPFSTTSTSPMKMLKEYVAQQDEEDADAFEYEDNATTFESDVMKAGLVSDDVAIDQVTSSLAYSFDGWEVEDIEERVEKAEQYMRALAKKEKLVFGYYGWSQSGCAAPVNVLLILSPKDKKVWAVELEPCSES